MRSSLILHGALAPLLVLGSRLPDIGLRHLEHRVYPEENHFLRAEGSVNSTTARPPPETTTTAVDITTSSDLPNTPIPTPDPSPPTPTDEPVPTTETPGPSPPSPTDEPFTTTDTPGPPPGTSGPSSTPTEEPGTTNDTPDPSPPTTTPGEPEGPTTTDGGDGPTTTADVPSEKTDEAKGAVQDAYDLMGIYVDDPTQENADKAKDTTDHASDREFILGLHNQEICMS